MGEGFEGTSFPTLLFNIVINSSIPPFLSPLPSSPPPLFLPPLPSSPSLPINHLILFCFLYEKLGNCLFFYTAPTVAYLTETNTLEPLFFQWFNFFGQLQRYLLLLSLLSSFPPFLPLPSLLLPSIFPYSSTFPILPLSLFLLPFSFPFLFSPFAPNPPFPISSHSPPRHFINVRWVFYK